MAEKSINIDAVLYSDSVYLSTDYFHVTPYSTLTKTIDIDAILKAIGKTESVNLDSLLKQIGISETISTDAILKLISVETIDIDAILKAIGKTESVNIDAYLKNLLQLTNLSLDAILKIVGYASANLDAVFQKNLQSVTNLDALITLISSSNISVDAILKAISSVTTLGLDSILKALSQTYSISLDSILKAIEVTSTNIDAILQAVVAALSYGEQNPTDGEQTVGWNTWSDGAGGSPTIIGDSSWGKIRLLTGEIAHGPVYNMGAGSHNIKLTKNKYGSGMGNFKVYIRGQESSFGQDDASPDWEEYTSQVVKTWVYIQAKLEGQ